MNIFESLENLNVSEECFNNIIDRIQRILEDNPPVVYHKFSDGQIVAQNQMFPTEHTGKIVNAKDAGAEYVKPKKVRKSSIRKKSKSTEEVPGQLKLF